MMKDSPLILNVNKKCRNLELMEEVLNNEGYAMVGACELAELDELLDEPPDVYMARGVSPEYFREELKSWEEAVNKHLNADHARSIGSIYDWMIGHHRDVVRLSRQAKNIYPPEVEWTDKLESLLSCLLECSSHNAALKMGGNIHDTSDLEQMYTEHIQPIMYRVGSMWAEGTLNVAEEHMVTAMVSRVMASSYVRLTREAPSKKGRVVLACATEEFHELGARIVGDTLELDGWDVIFLGSNVPASDFHRNVATNDPHIVGISATIPFHLLQMKEMIDGLENDADPKKTKILVGGLPFSIAPEAVERVGADACAHSGPEARELAARWWEEGCLQ
ncbi:MAG: cobalamin B12-binding domain-containing protein [Planctomycetota bacterium]